MYCRSCGAVNPDHALECSSCGKSLVNPYESSKSLAGGFEINTDGAPVDRKPPNYLAFAIFNTFCCCLPLGIVAIVFAAQVDTKWRASDYQGAINTSRQAKIWCWVSFGLGLSVNLIVVLLQFAAIMLQDGGF